jgi:hypothetical protein
MTVMNLLSNNANQIRLELRTMISGLFSYYSSGEASEDAWRSLLHLHCTTNGRSTDRLANLLRRLRRPRSPTPVEGLLGSFTSTEIQSIANSLAREGYYVFEQRVPSGVCDALAHFARNTPALVEGRGRSPEERVTFDPSAPVSKTYRIALEDLVTSPTVQELMADQVFLAVAERYLSTLPILCGTDMWWSPAFGSAPGADAAQLFHFDFDGAPIWLKYFVYLTDVTPETGPHMFVRGSHVANQPGAELLLRRGYVRICDEDISAAFGAENIIEICGLRGTVLAVDTRGFHKGKAPLVGHRLIAQLFYCCPQFNTHGPLQPLPAQVHRTLATAITKTPRVFERFPSIRRSLLDGETSSVVRG